MNYKKIELNESFFDEIETVNDKEIYQIVDSLKTILVVKNDDRYEPTLLKLCAKYPENQCGCCAFKNSYLCEKSWDKDLCNKYYIIDGDILNLSMAFNELNLGKEYYSYLASKDTISRLEAMNKLCNDDFCIYHGDCKSNKNCVIKVLFGDNDLII